MFACNLRTIFLTRIRSNPEAVYYLSAKHALCKLIRRRPLETKFFVSD
jgi:hypothetical protein